MEVGPTKNALSTEGGKRNLPKLEDMLVTRVAITSDAKDSMGLAEIEPVVADMDRNVDTNASNVNVSEEAANGPATTIAGLEQRLVITTGGGLDTGAVLSWITVMMVDSELPNTWAIADAISLERDEDLPAEAANTATVAAEEEGEDVQVVGTMPTVKLL